MQRFRFRSSKQGWKKEINEYGETYYRLYNFEKNVSVYDSLQLNNVLKTFLDPLVLNNPVTRTEIGDSFLFTVFNYLIISENDYGRLYMIKEDNGEVVAQADNGEEFLHSFFNVLLNSIRELCSLIAGEKEMSRLLAVILEHMSEDSFLDSLDLLNYSLKKIDSLADNVPKDTFRLGPYERSFDICVTNYLSL